MKLFPSIFGALLCTLILGGCATTATRRAISVRDLEVPRLIERIAQRQDGLKSIEAEGSIAVETPSFSNSGSFELRIKEPDSMLVNIEGPFGINIASIFLTNETFQFYNSLQNKLIHGTTSRAALGTLLHVDVGFSDILGLFVGAVSFDPLAAAPTAYYVEDGRYVLMYRKDDATTRYWVDPEKFSVTRIQVKDTSGTPIREVAFSDFRSQNTQWLPYRMKISDYRGGKSVTVIYSKAAVNGTNITFPFSVPENAEQVEWQ